MFTIHEGEIIYKEKYGSSANERLYVKPPDQGNVVVLGEYKLTKFTDILKKIFLPQGYPDSVSNDYTSYQIWDTAQAFCSTITNTLATQEVLRGVGVGDKNATPLAATITWVLKDGFGHLGKIMFAYSHGNHLDAYSKKWRLYADTLNDAAMCIEIALPSFKRYTIVMLCLSTVLKAIVGVAGGATRVAMTQHHAVRGNMADVAAKDSAQETAVNLIASLTAIVFITLFGSSLGMFVIMMLFHIIFNYFAVRAVCLKTLNETRFLQVVDIYLRQEIIANPCDVNRREPIIFYQLGPSILDLKLCGFKIVLGHSMKKVVKSNPHALYLKRVQEVYNFKKYVLLPNIPSRKIYVVLRDTATTEDILCAYFHSILFGITICAINDYPLTILRNPDMNSRPFPQICYTLQQEEWSRDARETPSERFIYDPSVDLMIFLNRIVNKEWPRINAGLRQIGWNLQQHILIVGEWRVCSPKLIARHISIGENVVPDVVKRASKMITFNADNDTTLDQSSEIKTYTIEPDVPLPDHITDPPP